LITKSNQIEIRHIRYFLAVAEELHFRRAADKLYISQPGLSRQIKEMEANLGILLFERHNRKVLLTKAGEYLKRELTGNLKILEQTLQHAKLINDGIDGGLKLGYVGSAIQKIIPDLLLKLREEYPKIHFTLKEMENKKQIENILSNDIDIGFVRLERIPKGLEIKPVLKENFCLVLPKDHVINSTNFESLLQFKDESFILFDKEYSTTYFEKVMQLFDDNGFTPNISHNTIHASSIYKLVALNFGISIIPKSLQTKSNTEVKFIELKNINRQTILSAVWNSNNRNPILSKFIKLLPN
jgi:DNA-binding transcriptional LysR family regulator